MYCGLCHTDVSIIDDEWGMSAFPVVPGHEVVGCIGQVGDQVTHLKPGQLVGLGWHSGYCNRCHSCNSGHQNLCGESTFTIVGHHGGFADKVRAEADAVIPIPDSIDPAKAGPFFCAGITVCNPLVQFDIKPNSQVGMIGIGGVGHLALQFLNAWGCEVTAFTSSHSKSDDALELGAHHTINSRDEDAVGEAAGRFDAILSTVNAKLDWNLYLSTLKPQGRLHFVGALTDPLDIDVFQLILGQRQVSGSPVGSPETISRMLEFAARQKIEPKVEMFPMSKVNDAIAHLKKGDARYRIVLEAGK